MKCDRCSKTIEPENTRNHLGQTLCEDCYMDTLSPSRACDPWAVHSAKSFEKQSAGAGALTPVQSQILRLLRETGGMEAPVLLRQLGSELTLKELEREFATLRHMEKARGEKRGDRIVWRLW
jgi:hypothetical protein